MPFMLWQDLQRVYVRHICPNLCSVLVLHACQIAYVCISRYVPCQIAMEYMHYMIYIYITEGSLEVKLPTVWTDGKSRGGKSQRREEQKREDQRRERARRKKMQVREKVAKSRNIVFFPMICGSGGSKVGLLKRVRSHVASWEMKSCTPLCREASLEVKRYKTHQNRTFKRWDVEKVWKSARCCGAKHILEVKMYKTRQGRTTFGSWDVEKVHAVVARIFTQHTSFGAFWKLRCRKSARCMPLWREAHFEVKSVKNWRARTTFGRQGCISRGRWGTKRHGHQRC